MPIDEPWARVKNPAPIPAPLSARDLLALPDADLAQLVRANLMPRTQEPRDRTAWTGLWRLLADHDELGDRAFDALEEMLDTTLDALEAGTLPEPAHRRAVKFQGQCEDAWRRLEEGPKRRPLAWAGERGDAFNAQSRAVIASLVSAIAKHRANRTSTDTFDDVDSSLWRSLRRVGLDPRDYPH